MDFSTAAKIVALRPALENVVVRSSSDPESIEGPPEEEQKLLDLITKLSHISAAGSTLDPQEALQM